MITAKDLQELLLKGDIWVTAKFFTNLLKVISVKGDWVVVKTDQQYIISLPLEEVNHVRTNYENGNVDDENLG